MASFISMVAVLLPRPNDAVIRSRHSLEPEQRDDMLDEPPPHQYDLNFSLGDIGVRVSPTFWLLAVLLGLSSGSALAVLIWVGVLFVSILIHELGHVLAFRRYGTPSRIVLYHFGGLAIPDGFLSRRKPLSSSERIIVSLAGPVAGFVFAGLVLLALQYSGGYVSWGFLPGGFHPDAPQWLNRAIAMILWINIMWGLVNLAPLYPLDGGQVAREALMMANPKTGMRVSLQLSVIAGAALALIGALQFNSIFMALMFGMLAAQSYGSLKDGFGGFR